MCSFALAGALTTVGTCVQWFPIARMAELADAPSSGGGSRKGVQVRLLLRAFWDDPAFFRPGFFVGVGGADLILIGLRYPNEMRILFAWAVSPDGIVSDIPEGAGACCVSCTSPTWR